MRVSLVATVLNEADNVADLLASIAAQVRAPDEIVIVDGGSADGTVEVLQSWIGRLPLVVLQRPGCNISQGRNQAIAHARGEIVAVTDAGVHLDPWWLARLVEPLEQGEADVAAGFFLSDPRTTFEVAMGATVLPTLEDIRPERFLPSSRSVAFVREAWRRVGGYPEWLDYCEDLVFDFALKEAGFRFRFVPEAVAYFRPRRDLRSFFLQYYRYARGDGKADLWRLRHAIRYGTYLGAATVLLAAGRRPAAWGLLLVGALAYLRRPWQRLWQQSGHLRTRERALAFALVPVIRLVGDVAKMVGYPVGVRWRRRHLTPGSTGPSDS
ncbi:MAG TPA: glycosyltransferase [Chloroflexota bacterium]